MSKAYFEDSRLDIILLSFYIFKREYYIIKNHRKKSNTNKKQSCTVFDDTFTVLFSIRKGGHRVYESFAPSRSHT